jgi:hypothetical protein
MRLILCGQQRPDGEAQAMAGCTKADYGYSRLEPLGPLRSQRTAGEPTVTSFLFHARVRSAADSLKPLRLRQCRLIRRCCVAGSDNSLSRAACFVWSRLLFARRRDSMVRTAIEVADRLRPRTDCICRQQRGWEPYARETIDPATSKLVPNPEWKRIHFVA